MSTLILDFVHDTYEEINRLNRKWENLKFVSLDQEAIRDNVSVSGDASEIKKYLSEEYFGDPDMYEVEIEMYMTELQ